jgi:cytochrome c
MLKIMKRTTFSLALSLAALMGSTSAFADLKLATEKNCMACHNVERKVLGPSYKDIAAKYVGQKDALAKLSVKVIKGGTGVWGQIPMPANAQVNEAEAKTLVTWILATK